MRCADTTMRRTQFLYDGLSRCLCPALDEQALARVVRASTLRRPVRTPNARSSRLIQLRPFSANALGEAQQQPQHISETDHTTPSINNDVRVDTTVAEEEKKKHQQQGPNLLKRTCPDLTEVSNEHIVAALRALRHGPDQQGHIVCNRHHRIVHLVKYLVQRRHYPLDAFIYECMMDAMVDPQGSAKGVAQLLKDMTAQNLTPTESICRSALEALAVHPDYTLRLQVLETMQRYWYPVDTPTSVQYIMLGMLRDGQYEMAYARLERMLDDDGNDKVDLWVYDIFVIVLGQAGFLDEMLRVLQRRKHARGTDDAFRGLLLHSLDRFSQAYHYEGTIWIWETAVMNGLLNPSNALLDNVLATASRHSDTDLAAKIIDILTSRGRVFKHQYEALAEAFSLSGDVAGALRVLSIMSRNGIHVNRGSTRHVYQALKKNPRLIEEARATIEEMHKEHEIPLQAISVLIESIAQIQGTDAALDLYHKVNLLTNRRPDYPMMKELILNASNPDTIWMLAKDYSVIISKDMPAEDSRIYDQMIEACAQQGDLDLAFSLAGKNILREGEGTPQQRSWRERPWVYPLIEHALKMQDGRIWPIVDGMVKGEDQLAHKTNVLLNKHRMVKRAEDWKAQKEGEAV